VAAFADAQVAVSKSERRGRTRAAIALLLDDARIGEIARMLSGDLGSTSDSGREHARELLDRSAKARAKARAR
jgi:DNA repair ATPase RecN